MAANPDMYDAVSITDMGLELWVGLGALVSVMEVGIRECGGVIILHR